MSKLTRRDMIVSAGWATALGMTTRLAIDPAWAQKTPAPAVGFYKYKVGAAEVTAIYDGIFEKPHDPGFFKNASVDETKAALVKGGLPPDFVSIPITVVVVKIGDKLILCDSGTGSQLGGAETTAGRLAAGMTAAGIDPTKISTILLSHFHPDHIFGLMEKGTNKPIYPNAELVVNEVEYNWWTEAGRVEKLPDARKGLGTRIQAVFPTWKNFRLVKGEVEVTPGIRFVAAPGHTPGHTAFHLSSGNEQLMISNDTAYVPALSAAHPEWRGFFDQDGDMAEVSRRKLLDRVIAEKMNICGYHFPFPGVGTFEKDGTGYALISRKV